MLKSAPPSPKKASVQGEGKVADRSGGPYWEDSLSDAKTSQPDSGHSLGGTDIADRFCGSYWEDPPSDAKTSQPDSIPK